jgi:hypothetical protein
MTDQSATTAVPAAAEQPGRRPDPIQRLALFAVRWLVIYPGWWLLRRTGRALWRGRDIHAVWWAAVAVYAATAAAYAAGVPWWSVAVAAGALAIAVHQIQSRWPWLPAEPETVSGAVAVAGVWSAVAVAAVPWSRPAAAAWTVWAVAVTVWWWRNPDARSWRHLRARVRNWTAALPMVLAELGAAGVVIAERPAIAPNGRVEFPLRLPIRVTREILDAPKMRREIESAMHWPADSIRGVEQDPRHRASSRVRLVWHECRIKARTVKADQMVIPSSVYDPLWHGVDDDGADVLIATCVPGIGISRGLYGGKTGSAKTNLLRLIACLRAHCPDVLIWVIDLKNNGATFAALLPRIDRIAVTWEQASEMLQDAAAMIPLRGRLLRPEHNQVLPLSPDVPAVLIIGDEIATLLGKKQSNRVPIAAANAVTSKGRALGVGAEFASQYMAQANLHPDLLPNFDRSFCGRTRTKADSQHLLSGWNRLDTPGLPTGAFYLQEGGEDPRLLFTPEVTDAMLAETAEETAHLAPRLEEPTARDLPFYAGRWAGLPEHLLPYCSSEQRAMVEAARAKPAGTVTRLRTAAATPPGRLVVSERIGGDELVDDDGEVLDNGGGDVELDPALAAMCNVLEAAANVGGQVRTKDLVAAAEEWRRSRSWAAERVRAWAREGVTCQAGRGLYRVSCPPEGVRSRVAAVEGTLARGRRGPAVGGDGR